MNLRSLLASTFGAVLLAQIAAPASAITLISETFDNATLGRNRSTGIPSFNVASGNVDVLGPGLSDRYPDNGNYIDLNGNTKGKLTSNIFSFNTGDQVTLSFDYGANGNRRNANVSLGSLFTPFQITDSRNPLDPIFQTYTNTFTVNSAFNGALSFASNNIGFNGIILDNVSLSTISSTPTAVPEPTAIPGLVLFGGAALMLRRKQLAKNAKAQFDS
jgi:hypothetical protein